MKSESNSKEALAKRVDASFKKEERFKDAKLGAAACETGPKRLPLKLSG
jgi:hypothetical protein